MISTGTNSIKQSIEQLKDSMTLLNRNELIESISLNPIVRNVVATLNIGKKLNLEVLGGNLSRSRYLPTQFPGLIFRIPNLSTILIFSSGKMVITGAKSEEELMESAKIIHKIVEKPTYF